jgi:hypothetical protein
MPGRSDFFLKVFAKNLSDYSTGTYWLLCKEVGKTFEVVSSHKECLILGSITSMCDDTRTRKHGKTLAIKISIKKPYQSAGCRLYAAAILPNDNYSAAAISVKGKRIGQGYVHPCDGHYLGNGASPLVDFCSS